MVGWGLDGYEGRIPCPHCGSTDCTGTKTVKGGRVSICCITQKRVTEKQLRESAEKHGMKKIKETCEDCGEEITKPYKRYDVTKIHQTHTDGVWKEGTSKPKILKLCQECAETHDARNDIL